MMKNTDLSQALRDVFISPNEADRNFEAANVVDGLFAIARAIVALAKTVEKQNVKISSKT